MLELSNQIRGFYHIANISIIYPTYHNVRLGLVGPLLAVRLQMSLFTEAEKAATIGSKGAPNGMMINVKSSHHHEGPRQDNPLLDILQVSRKE